MSKEHSFSFPQVVITPWSWAMSAKWSFFSKGTGQESSKGMCTTCTKQLSVPGGTTSALQNHLKKNTLFVFVWKITLLLILFGLKKSTEYKYYSVWKITRIRIRILFGLKNSPEYEYEYYLVWKNHPNTNTNIIRFEKITRIRIRILFGLKISTEYEYEYFGIRILFE